MHFAYERYLQVASYVRIVHEVTHAGKNTSSLFDWRVLEPASWGRVIAPVSIAVIHTVAVHLLPTYFINLATRTAGFFSPTPLSVPFLPPCACTTLDAAPSPPTKCLEPSSFSVSMYHNNVVRCCCSSQSRKQG